MKEKKREKVVAALYAGYRFMEDWEREGDLALNCEDWCDDVGMAGDYYRYGGDQRLWCQAGHCKNLEQVQVLCRVAQSRRVNAG